MRIGGYRRHFSTHWLRRIFTSEGFQVVTKQTGLRHFVAILLISFFAGLYVVPLVNAASSDPDSNLPVCCRRHGGKSHHCAMMTAYLASHMPGTKVMATPVPCPDCPSTLPVSVHVQLGLASVSTNFAEISSDPAKHTHTAVRARIALDRAWRKRGPPPFRLS